MAIKITVSNTVSFQVRGTVADEGGNAQAFSFSLIAKRLLSDELQAYLADEDRKVPDFMAGVVTDWRGVLDDEGNTVPFSADALHRLFQIPGIAGLAFRQYLIEIGAKEKI